MSNEFTFVITSPIEVSEALSPSKMILSGIFIRLNTPTGNGRIYQVDEAEQIATDLKGMPVFFGANTKGIHLTDENHMIGRIIETIIDKTRNIIRGKVEVWNNGLFPTLLQQIAPGWGFSIGGKVADFIGTGKFNERFMPILHAIGMKANHIALLPPQVRRGDSAAKVDEMIPVMESLSFDPCPFGVCEAINNTQLEDGQSLKELLDKHGEKKEFKIEMPELKDIKDQLNELNKKLDDMKNPVPPIKVNKKTKRYILETECEGDTAVIQKN